MLADRHEAPRALLKVSGRGVPARAILFSTIIGFLCVVMAYIAPDTVFLFLLNSSGAVILFVYLLIAISQLILRRRTDSAQLEVKMWLFPFLTLLAIAAIVGVLVLMAINSDTRSQLLLSLLSWAFLLIVWALTRGARRARVEASEREVAGAGD